MNSEASSARDHLPFTDVRQQTPGQRTCSGDRDPRSDKEQDQHGPNSKHPQENTTQQNTCDSCGGITFSGYGSVSREAFFMRVHHEREMKEVRTVLEKTWELPCPDLLISVTGGAKIDTMKPRLGEILKQGLVNAAVETKAWLITGGTAEGVMKLVGEAVYDQRSANPEKELVALGIASWGFVANHDKLKPNTKETPVQYKLEEAKQAKKCEGQKFSPLDHNHTHFLLVDDGTVGKPAGEIKFRTDLEKFISTKGYEDKAGRKVSAVPSVLVMVGGGVNTLKTVLESTKRGIPVVVIAGSGRAADLISEFVTAKVNQTECEPSDRLYEQMTTRATKLLSEEEKEEAVKYLEQILPCKEHLPSICRPNDAELVKDITKAVLCALSKASTSRPYDLLKLCLKWNCCDIARKEIFSSEDRDRFQPEDLDKAMVDALVEDKEDFVTLFLDQGMELKEFLTVENLYGLYDKCLAREEMSDMFHLKISFNGKSQSLRRTLWNNVVSKLTSPHMLLGLNEVVAHFLDDEIFQFYSDEHTSQADKQDGNNRQKIAPTSTSGEETSNKPKVCSYKPEASKRRFDHPEQKLFLWALLFNRRKLALLFWKNGRDHIGGALCASALLKRLSARAAEKDREALSKDLKNHSSQWQERAVDVLSKCYSANPDRTRCLLVRELNHWAKNAAAPANEETSKKPTDGDTGKQPTDGDTGKQPTDGDTGKQPTDGDTGRQPTEQQTACRGPSCVKGSGWPTPLDIVMMYRLKEFAGQAACQTKMSTIWKGRLAPATSGFMKLLCIFVPIFLLAMKFDGDPEKAKNQEEPKSGGSTKDTKDRATKLKPVKLCCYGKKDNCISFCQAVCNFYSAPVIKFFCNFVRIQWYPSFQTHLKIEGK